MISRLASCLCLWSLGVGVGAAGCTGDGGAHADGAIDCSHVSGADTYSPGLEHPGANGYVVQLIDAQPSPPAKGDNVWNVRVLNPDQTPASGMDISVKTWMPHHQHGSPINAEVTHGPGAGEYVLNPVNLFMPGIWEVTINIGNGAAAVDAVTFTFCIDG
jgi:hypothetical protein